MKKYKITLLIFLSLMIFDTKIYSQSGSAEVSMLIDIDDDNLTCDVSLFIQRTGSTAWSLGFSSFVFNYNSSGLTFDSELAEGIWDNNTSSDYDDQVSISYGPSARSIDIGKTTGVGGTDIPNLAPQLIGTLRFTITNISATHNITWNPSLSLIEDFSGSNDNTENITFTNLPNEPLPVELNTFSAKTNGSSVELKWQTATEINNLGFEVERRVKDKPSVDWKKINFIKGNGNSNSTKNYSYSDKNPVGGTRFLYRLKQIDNDGSFSYSDEVEVELLPDKFELYQNYPNPFNPVTNIKFSLPQNSKVRIDIYNIIGEHITTLINKEMEAGFHNIPFTAENLSSGTYIYRIQAQDFSQTKKMLLLK